MSEWAYGGFLVPETRLIWRWGSIPICVDELVDKPVTDLVNAWFRHSASNPGFVQIGFSRKARFDFIQQAGEDGGEI